MQSVKILFLSLLVSFALASCEEVGPAIDFATPCDNALDTVYMETPESPDPKVVLLEELTGFNCVNCPLGHVEAKSISDANPGRLAIVGIVDFPSDPHPNGREDYRTTTSASIHSSFLGTEPGYPSGAIDRKLFAGESAKCISRFAWAANVTSQMALTPDMNIDIVNVLYDGTSGQLSCEVEVHYTNAVSVDQNLTVLVLENNIVDYQYTPSTAADPDYVNNHILRGAMTPASGTTLSLTKVAGAVSAKSFCLDIPSNWVESELEIVAFVHNTSADEEVQQAAVVAVP